MLPHPSDGGEIMGHAAFTLPHRSPYLLLFALALVVVEYLWHRHRHTDGYDLKESAASLAVAIGRLIPRALSAAVLAPVFLWVYDHRVFTIPVEGVVSALALILLAELVYYWFHRASHAVRWFWASHSVHHSSTRMNLTAAYRLGWTDFVSGDWVFFLIPVWLGFSPVAVVAAIALNLTYQFFLHTEAVKTLGPLDWILNTPAHHRVHHAKNAECLDKNFGGMLIIYDRLFGTFAEAPAELLQYGLVAKAPTANPFKIAFGEWIAMAKELVRARSPKFALRAVLGRP